MLCLNGVMSKGETTVLLGHMKETSSNILRVVGGVIVFRGSRDLQNHMQMLLLVIVQTFPWFQGCYSVFHTQASPGFENF